MTARNIRAVSLALLLFIYPVLALSTASIHYTETIHRVTTGKNFHESVFGSQLADSLGALGFLLLFVGLAYGASQTRIISVAIFAIGVALYAANSGILQVVGLATVPSLAAALLAEAILSRRPNQAGKSASTLQARLDIKKVMAGFLIIIIILEIGALSRWVTYPIIPSDMYGDLSWKFAELESALFHSMGLLSPFLVVLIAFSFFYKWFAADVFKKLVHHLKSNNLQSAKVWTTPSEGLSPSLGKESNTTYQIKAISPGAADAGTSAISRQDPKKATTISRNLHWIILSAALVTAPLLMAYPHLPGVNPAGSGVSTDEQYYMNWMTKLRTGTDTSWTETIAKAFTINKGDRPLTLLLILSTSNLTGAPDLMVVRFLPVLLAPMLVSANFVLIRYSLKSHDDKDKLKLFAPIGAIFAAFSPQIVVGEYAGLLANWLALIAAYFAFYFLLKAWESKNRNEMISSFGILFAILLVTMLLHVYTWANLLVIIILFGGISFIFAHKNTVNPKIKIILIVTIVGLAFALDSAKSFYFDTPAVAESDSNLASNIQTQDSGGLWDRLFFTLHTYVGGFLSNPVLFLLALIWIIKADLSRGFERLFLSMFFILALPLAFGSIEFQTRVLYNVPIQIPALLVLSGAFSTPSKNRATWYLLIIAISLSLAVYALRAMASLYLELPEGLVLDKQFLLP